VRSSFFESFEQEEDVCVYFSRMTVIEVMVGTFLLLVVVFLLLNLDHLSAPVDLTTPCNRPTGPCNC